MKQHRKGMIQDEHDEHEGPKELLGALLRMFKLPDRKLRTAWWLAVLLATSGDAWRFSYAVSVALFALPVILDLRLRGREGPPDL